MAAEKVPTAQLRRFAQAFREARERGATDSDAEMYLAKFFEDVLECDS